MQYKINYSDEFVHMQASGLASRRIQFNDIASVRYENDLVKGRPFLRISIYAKDGVYVDVSLKHFLMSDLRLLVEKIHALRPDVELDVGGILEKS